MGTGIGTGIGISITTAIIFVLTQLGWTLGNTSRSGSTLGLQQRLAQPVKIPSSGSRGKKVGIESQKYENPAVLRKEKSV